MDRFAGLTRSHGTYALGSALKADAKGKLTGARKTVHEPITLELWQKHLDGKYAIGVVPIRLDNLAVFGAIDIDIYDLDLKQLNTLIQKRKLPLILCRTKSGGAHLYLFTKEPVPAVLIRDKLVEWAIALGYAGCEVFPKQIQLAGPNDPVEDVTGNWINMPYAQGANTLRYALDPKTGESLSMEEFLDLADKKALTEAKLEAVELPPDPTDDLLRGAPPCLISLARTGWRDYENNGLFNVGVYLRKRIEQGWEDHIDKYNLELGLNVASKDVQATVKSLKKKSYSYMCKQEPCVAHCNKGACREAEFGIGGLPDDPGITYGTITKMLTDPVTWIVEVNGKRIEVDTPTLMDQRRMATIIMEKLSIWPDIIKPGTYKRIIKELTIATVGHEIAVPEDATREGQMWSHLMNFCTSNVQARAMDELLLGKPYNDVEKGVTFFRSGDYLKHLRQQNFAITAERDVWRFLSRRGAEHYKGNFKGKFINYWSVPSFQAQTEEFTVPRVKMPDEM